MRVAVKVAFFVAGTVTEFEPFAAASREGGMLQAVLAVLATSSDDKLWEQGLRVLATLAETDTLCYTLLQQPSLNVAAPAGTTSVGASSIIEFIFIYRLPNHMSYNQLMKDANSSSRK